MFLKKNENFDPIGYNYWDYIDAWTRVFWYQNKTYHHSWIIYFKRNNKYNFQIGNGGTFVDQSKKSFPPQQKKDLNCLKPNMTRIQ